MGLCAPFAIIYYLTSLSSAFSEFFHNVVTAANGCVRLLLYGDVFVPGNPNRVDKGRSLMSIYHTFLDFPEWLLNRCDGWFVFGELRSKLVEGFKRWLSFAEA